MLSLKQKGDTDNSKNSFLRTLELIDLTIDQRKSRELLRLREVICDIFLSSGNYNISVESLKNYFIQFALLANK